MDNQVFIIISAVLFGLVVGAIIMYFASGSSRNEEEKIAQVEKKLNKYQQDVVQHFETTADLVDDLTQSYKKVFDHLSVSAKQLLTDEQVKEQIEKRKGKKIILGFLSDESEVNGQEEEVDETESQDDTIDKFAEDMNTNQAENSEEVEQSEHEQAETMKNDGKISDNYKNSIEIDEVAEDNVKDNTDTQDEKLDSDNLDKKD